MSSILAVATVATVAAAAHQAWGLVRIPAPTEVELEYPAIVLSDLHYPHTCCKSLLKRVFWEEAASIVVCGDLFDDLHRPLGKRSLEKAVEEALDSLGFPAVPVLYVTSGSSHDPVLRGIVHLRAGGRPVVASGGVVCSGPFCFTHGDLAIRNGAVAHVVNRTLGGLFLEKVLRRRLGLSDRWLVMGHTHIPGLDKGGRVANTGSWKSYWRRAAPNPLLAREDGALEPLLEKAPQLL